MSASKSDFTPLKIPVTVPEPEMVKTIAGAAVGVGSLSGAPFPQAVRQNTTKRTNITK
jgi:hypothetical protein